MSNLLNLKPYVNLRNKFSKITNLKYFEHVYILLLALFGIVAWYQFSLIGLVVLICLTALMLILTADTYYIIPNITYAIFMISNGVSSSDIPVPLIVLAGVLLFILVLFTIFKGFKIKKMKSALGLLLMGIGLLIPIIWGNKYIKEENSVFYFLYIAGILYFLVYFVFINGMEKRSLKMISLTMSFLGVLLAFECFLHVFRSSYNLDFSLLWAGVKSGDIFSKWYYLGWGLCNEAGIMMCFSLPFTFYLLAKDDSVLLVIKNILVVLITLIGVLLTTSRGSYLCAGLISIVSVVMLFINAKKKVFMRVLILSCLAAAIILFFSFHNYTFPFCEKMIDTVFDKGLDNNGREELWETSANMFINSPIIEKIFGSGYASVQGDTNSAVGPQLTPIVMHSTLWQTLTCSGIFGIIALAYHFFSKYHNLFMLEDKKFVVYLFMGFLAVDLYGFIDNTYHMYYYMIPLAITLAAIDNNMYYLEPKYILKYEINANA